MAVDPAGTLLVSEPSAGRVLALADKNGDGKADSVQTVVTGLDQPHGLAFREGALYVAETSRVQRFAYDPATMKATRGTVLARLPSGGGHWTRTVVFGPDGRMYASDPDSQQAYEYFPSFFLPEYQESGTRTQTSNSSK